MPGQELRPGPVPGPDRRRLRHLWRAPWSGAGCASPDFAGIVALGDWARSGGTCLDVGLVIGGLWPC